MVCRLSYLAGMGLIAIWAGGACYRSAPTTNDTQILRRAIGGEPASLDPAAVADFFAYQVMDDLYEGLTVESASGEALPGVAESWTIEESGRLYTFQLRISARWSNGKPVRAQEFVTAWRRVVNPKTASPVADNLRLIAGASAIIERRASPDSLGVSAPSDHILVVHLEQPAAYFPQLLTQSATYPVYSDSSARSHLAGDHVSNGPFALAQWVIGSEIRLVKNSQYWDREKVKLNQIEYHILTNDSSQYAGFRSGELDMTDQVPTNAIAALRASHSTDLFLNPLLNTAYYGLNLTTKPFKTNIKLRQALAMAINRQKIVEQLAAGQLPAFGFVPPGTWNYQGQSWSWATMNESGRIAEAKRLYAESGHSITNPLHLRLLLNTNVGIKNTAIIIAAMWKEVLGIDTELVIEENRVFLETRHDKSRWEVARLAWLADFNDASNFLDIFRANSPNNDFGYSNPQFEDIQNDAAKTSSVAHRRHLLETGEKIVLDDYPVIPLYYFVSKRLIKSYVAGVQKNPLDRHASKWISIVPH